MQGAQCGFFFGLMLAFRIREEWREERCCKTGSEHCERCRTVEHFLVEAKVNLGSCSGKKKRLVG